MLWIKRQGHITLRKHHEHADCRPGAHQSQESCEHDLENAEDDKAWFLVLDLRDHNGLPFSSHGAPSYWVPFALDCRQQHFRSQ